MLQLNIHERLLVLFRYLCQLVEEPRKPSYGEPSSSLCADSWWCLKTVPKIKL
jgi:hypothetical protein